MKGGEIGAMWWSLLKLGIEQEPRCRDAFVALRKCKAREETQQYWYCGLPWRTPRSALLNDSEVMQVGQSAQR